MKILSQNKLQHWIAIMNIVLILGNITFSFVEATNRSNTVNLVQEEQIKGLSEKITEIKEAQKETSAKIDHLIDIRTVENHSNQKRF